MPTPDDDPEDIHAASSEEDDGPYLARPVVESELLDTGRAAPTGIHVTLWGPDCVGLDAWTIGRLWGWTEPELAALEHAGEHIILVLQTPGPRWGEARAEVLASALMALRPDEVGTIPFSDLVRAIGTPWNQAPAEGLAEAQRVVAKVFGLREPLFGSGRIPAGDEPSSSWPFFIDTQVAENAVNALLPGTSAFVDEYADEPTLIRLKWQTPDGTSS